MWLSQVPPRLKAFHGGGGALLPLAKAVLSAEGSTGGEPSSELTLAVTDRSQFLTGCWLEVTDRSQFLTGCWLEPSPPSQGISTGQLASYRAGKVGEGA